MGSGSPDHTLRVRMVDAFGYSAKLPVWEVEPWTGLYQVTPATLTDGEYTAALVDSNSRLIVKAILDSTSAEIDTDVSDRAGRLLGKTYGSQSQILQQKTGTYELLNYDSFVATLLGAGLPTALDSGALKVKEQSPITSLSVSNFPSTYDVSDRAARLLGVIYGSQGAQLQQKVTTNDLIVTLDAESVAVTNANLDAALSTLATHAKQDAMITALQIIDDMDIKKIGGTAQTGRDLTPDIKTLTDNTDTDKYRVLSMAKGKTTLIKEATAANATTTVYTVTALKTFYLCDAWLFVQNAGGSINNDAYLQVDTGGDGVFRNLGHTFTSSFANLPTAIAVIPVPLADAMPFPAGTVFRVSSNSANLTANAGIVGWEE